jgi:hypothetical protein
MNIVIDGLRFWEFIGSFIKVNFTSTIAIKITDDRLFINSQPWDSMPYRKAKENKIRWFVSPNKVVARIPWPLSSHWKANKTAGVTLVLVASAWKLYMTEAPLWKEPRNHMTLIEWQLLARSITAAPTLKWLGLSRGGILVSICAARAGLGAVECLRGVGVGTNVSDILLGSNLLIRLWSPNHKTVCFESWQLDTFKICSRVHYKVAVSLSLSLSLSLS